MLCLSINDLFILVTFVCYAVTQNTSQELYVRKKELNGARLLALGDTYNNTLLKLIGSTLENVQASLEQKICRLSPCSDWTLWTNCNAPDLHSFGFSTRNRSCWYNGSSPCSQDGGITVENESRMCEFVCRSDYNISRNKFCVKLYTNKLTHTDAEKQCQRDGGHLMNPDTQNRWNDFEQSAKELKLGDTWIDGTRTSVGSSWVFKGGLDMEQSSLNSKWYSGQPSNSSTELCLITGASNNVRHLYDHSCSYATFSICELTFRLRK